jgi:hypothetical protein
MPKALATDAEYIAKFKANCVITESGCWEWQGHCAHFRGIKPGQRGYAKGSAYGKSIRIHRWMIEATQRKLQPGEVARHKCDNPPCINPDHLHPGTQKDNIRDAIAQGKQQFHPSRYTACKNGHQYTPETLWVDKYGFRHCRTCQRIRQRKAYGWPAQLAESLPPVKPGQIAYSKMNR